ncbi:MAG: aminotransferase class III-fold pyridoxal phosphate-dependent enzyme [Deltaproteobacteria bacterium]|nr:aminotransferase class III-fold pyridoxal phosphate-dependent enzyme [Deltaproteobacteria bacterium]
MDLIATLQRLRDLSGPADTVGLSDGALAPFLKEPALLQAAAEALVAREALPAEADALVRGPEGAMRAKLQAGFVNFYPDDTVNPYVPLAARGPWVVTTHGAVLHDSGGYGMLGFGHAPQAILDVMARPWVMANIMTPSVSQQRLEQQLRIEIGHARAGGCPFHGFIALNSGSEAVTLAARISDVNARRLTDPGGRHEGKTVRLLSLAGSFHGRTDRPAQLSDSTRAKYRAELRTFRDASPLDTVPPNDLLALQAVFDRADAENVFYEALFMEPVMGEGDPGKAITREFYDLARALTASRGTLLVIDSVQAGIRAQGTLSFVDYPGFEDAVIPDMETYSKAVNGGQFPLSILSLSDKAAALYVRGIYGNTMTGNPRAMEIATTVLEQITPALRTNIRERGAEFLERFQALQAEFPSLVTGSQGTGLLISISFEPGKLKVVGYGGLEEHCRHTGIGVIHGGTNSLRYTPHFGITSAEIALMVDNLRAALLHFSA